MRAPEITLKNLTLAYERHPAVHHLSGTFAGGSLTAVVGPNGAGKSTLLKALAGLLPVASGAIDLGDLKRGELAYLPQQASLDRSFPISLFDFAALGLWHSLGAGGGLGRREKQKVMEILERVGLAELAKRPIGTLSGGQLQRTLFARILLQDARVILLDEPFAGIDTKTQDELFHLIEAWQKEGRSTIAVLHDLSIVRAHFPQTLILAREPIAWGPTVEVLSDRNLLHARRHGEAWDEHAPICLEPAA